MTANRSPATGPNTTSLPGSGHAAVLLVGGDPVNARLLGELLRSCYQVLAAGSGQAALAMAAAEPRPELILLDLEGPGQEGQAVFRQLRASAQAGDIPVILIADADAADEAVRGLEFGAADYLTRPLRAPVVLARVRAQIELKRSRDWLRGQNAFLEAEVARRLEENRLIQDISIHALARLAEARDLETGNHLRRTQEYVHLLADSLRGHPRFAAYLAEHSVEALVQSALLHDIGKIGIPDHILLKPGKLSPEEREIMKTHARLGSDAIEQAKRDAARPLEFLSMAQQIALYHHERWDGGGYPEGLAGEAIPIPARLMALADVFDALISRRFYKWPWSFVAAREMIAQERGQHFDPDVVDAFLARFDDFEAAARRYAGQYARPMVGADLD
jgi:putative two-component system response regulator